MKKGQECNRMWHGLYYITSPNNSKRSQRDGR